MNSLKSNNQIREREQYDSQPSYQNVRDHLQILEKQYNLINEEITTNLKVFDEIIADDKQTYEKIKRNLEDIKTIFVNDLDKFQETVDKSIQYNEALYTRLQKDAHYIRQDQEGLRKKMIQMEKRINQMQEQIGIGF